MRGLPLQEGGQGGQRGVSGRAGLPWEPLWTTDAKRSAQRRAAERIAGSGTAPWLQPARRRRTRRSFVAWPSRGTAAGRGMCRRQVGNASRKAVPTGTYIGRGREVGSYGRDVSTCKERSSPLDWTGQRQSQSLARYLVRQSAAHDLGIALFCFCFVQSCTIRVWSEAAAKVERWIGPAWDGTELEQLNWGPHRWKVPGSHRSTSCKVGSSSVQQQLWMTSSGACRCRCH